MFNALFDTYLSINNVLSHIPYIVDPVPTARMIPAFCSCSTSSKTIPSHPFATSMSTATGKYSDCKVIVELYPACPIGTTISQPC